MSWTKEIQKLRERKRLEKRAVCVHNQHTSTQASGYCLQLRRDETLRTNQYVSACVGDLDKIQKAMVARSKRKIAYALLQKFKNAYLEWIEEKKHSDEIVPTEEELKELKSMPFITMVFSVGSNNEKKVHNPEYSAKVWSRWKMLRKALKKNAVHIHFILAFKKQNLASRYVVF